MSQYGAASDAFAVGRPGTAGVHTPIIANEVEDLCDEAYVPDCLGPRLALLEDRNDRARGEAPVSVKVDELMARQVVTARPHQTVEHVRGMLERNQIHAVPVVDDEGVPIGIVSLSDLLGKPRDGAPVSQLMTDKVYTVPQYEDVAIAARVMRNHEIHRVIVTHEKKVVGILSAFDLLQLVEGHRFVMKQPPTPRKRGSGGRA